MLAPVTWRTPPRHYGPWEQVASVLTEALVSKGVDITLFATGDSVTTGHLKSVVGKPVGEFPTDAKVMECLHISYLMEQAAEFDIIHNHFDFLPLTYSRLVRTPLITTIHGFSSPDIVPVYKKYNNSGHYVSISHSDRHPDLTYLDTVYNGIDTTAFELGYGNGGYLLYFGRIHPHKGAYEAIQIAAKANLPLIICGLIQEQSYFDENVAPFLNDNSVIYLGNVGPNERNRLMGEAIALLHPISFDEPFGLSVVESMSCGTPVIAFERGSMKELIEHGKTGFLVYDVDEAFDAVKKISSISRSNCRNRAVERFSGQVMALHYLALYQQIISAFTSL